MQISASQMPCRGDHLPLCRAYELVHLGVPQTFNRGPLLPPEYRVLSCIGAARDAQVEVLGAWPVLVSETSPAHRASVDLLARGVERVGLLFNGVAGDMDPAVLGALDGASAVLSFHSVAQTAISAAAPVDRKAVSEGLALVRRARSQAHAEAVLDGLSASQWRGCPAVVEICRAAIPKWQAVYALSGRARAAVMRGEDAAWAMQQGVSRAMARHGCFESAESAASFAEAWLLEEEGRQRRRRVALRYRAAVAAARSAG